MASEAAKTFFLKTARYKFDKAKSYPTKVITTLVIKNSCLSHGNCNLAVVPGGEHSYIKTVRFSS